MLTVGDDAGTIQAVMEWEVPADNTDEDDEEWDLLSASVGT